MPASFRSQNLAMLPLKGIVRRALRLPECPLTNEPPQPLSDEFVALPKWLGARASRLHRRGVLRRRGRSASMPAEQDQLDDPVIGPSTPNDALEFFDVDTDCAVEAFEAVGLGRKRHTEDW